MMEQRCELLKKMGTTDIGAIAEESRHHDQKVANHDETLKKNIVNIDNTMTWSPTHNQNKNNIKDEVRSKKEMNSDIKQLIEKSDQKVKQTSIPKYLLDKL